MNTNQFHPVQEPWLHQVHNIALAGIRNGRVGVFHVAETMGISERCLQRKLKNSLGVSPKQFLAELQMQEAKKRLETGQAGTIHELAESLGFKNAHYFTVKYQKRFSKKPIEYFSC